MIIIGLLACTIVTTMVILGGALALNVLTGINVKIAVLVIPLAFCFYSSITGLRGSIITDYLQVAIILIIGLGLSVIFYYKYGDFGICSMVENFHDKGKFLNITLLRDYVWNCQYDWKFWYGIPGSDLLAKGNRCQL